MPGSVDPFAMSDKLEDPILQVIAARLESRGKFPFFAHIMHEYLDFMQIDTAKMVLDMGCGTGVVARSIVQREGFLGRVVGIDLSPFLIDFAARLAAEEGVADRLEFQVGDSRRLDLGDASFDAVVAHTLFSHVDDPLTILKESARLLQPGGMLAIFDGDYASLTFGHADPIKGKADDEALIKEVVTSPRVMRQMPRLLRAAGLNQVASFPYVIAEIGTADVWLNWIESFRKIIPKSGAMTEDETDAWAEALVNDSKAGVFFGASNYYTYIAQRN